MQVDGNCYEVHGRMITNEWVRGNRNPNYVLVHGIVCPLIGPLKGWRYAHAWLESKDSPIVFDYSNSTNGELEVVRGIYYLIGGIQDHEVVRYTAEEARAMVLAHNTWGPWDAAQIALGELGEPPQGVDVRSIRRQLRDA